MNLLTEENIPKEARHALYVIEKLLKDSLIGVYLFGSAVNGGLRPDSDIDILAVVDKPLPETTRKEMRDALLFISGEIGNTTGLRPLEVTVINYKDIFPWKYPPKREFIFGEWLRTDLENGQVPSPAYDPDLTIILAQIHQYSLPLKGPSASELLDTVPNSDIRRAIKDSIPELVGSINGDERNVLLTLARMWLTSAEGKIESKDVAAQWALLHLPDSLAYTLDKARKGYLGEYSDDWEGTSTEVLELSKYMRKGIESFLND